MTSVPPGLANNISMESNQSPSRRYYGSSPSRRHHTSSYGDASYLERPLLQSTPCHVRRHYDTCPTEAHWNGRDAAAGVRAVVHRVRTSAQPPPPSAVNDDKPADKSADNTSSPAGCSCGSIRFRSQAQMVDIMSRILFPCMFLIFNVVYWPYYLFVAAP